MIYRFLPSIIYFMIIWYFSSSELPVDIGSADKTLHVLAYALMGFLLSFGFALDKNNYKKMWLIIFTSGFILGMLDEFHQYFVPGRSAEIYDLIANAIGIFTGMLWFLFLKCLFFKYLKK